jgi:hypothetical protein
MSFMLTRSDRIRIVSLFYFVYFCLYAVTPLSFSYRDVALEKTESTIENFGLFVIEVLCSNIFHKSTAEKSSTVNILLLKKRSLVSENGSVNLTFEGSIATVRKTMPAALACEYSLHSKEFKYRLPIYAYRSGLSPPSA